MIINRASIFALLLLATVFIAACGDDEGSGSGRSVATVKMGSIEETVTAQGKLEPRYYVDVGAQVSGQLKKIHVEIGRVVEEGDLLAEIDPRIYEARVLANTARLKTLQAQKNEEEASLAYARQQLKREEQLLKSLATSAQTVDQARAAEAASEARVKALLAQAEEVQSELDGDRTNLGFTKIIAPMSGVVVDLPAREGQTLNANQTAPLLLQLANLDQMTVRAQVAEADISKIRPGMQAYFTTLGQMDRRWTGTVRQVLPSPEVINEVVLFNVLIDVQNDDRALMKGMSTQIFFVIGNADNVPLIPYEALGARIPDKDSGDARAYEVLVSTNGKDEERIILVGLATRTEAEVRSGLAVNDSVVIRRGGPEETTGGRRGPSWMRGPRL